jgi:hypothetical protein
MMIKAIDIVAAHRSAPGVCEKPNLGCIGEKPANDSK